MKEICAGFLVVFAYSGAWGVILQGFGGWPPRTWQTVVISSALAVLVIGAMSVVSGEHIVLSRPEIRQ